MSSGSTHADAVHPDLWYKHWGFDAGVFRAVEARLEMRLREVFRAPVWLYEVVKSVEDTSVVTVSGPRGSGKTALRNYIADYCTSEIAEEEFLGGRPLVIAIDHDLVEWVGRALQGEDVIPLFGETLRDMVTLAICFTLGQEDVDEKLSRQQRDQLARLLVNCSKYGPEQVKTLFSTLKHRFKDKYKRFTEDEIVQDVISVGRAALGASSEGQPIGTSTEHIGTLREDLRSLREIAQGLGFEAIYVLIDEIDEFQGIQRYPIRGAEIVASLLSCRWLMELSGYAHKFFLSDPITNNFKAAEIRLGVEIRSDRTGGGELHRLAWKDGDIAEMLKSRLRAYSDGTHESLAHCCNEDVAGSVDRLIVGYALGSPRYFIEIGNRIGKAAARNAGADNWCITESSLETAIIEYCRWYCASAYEREGFTQFIESVDGDEFSIDQLSNAADVETEDIEKLVKQLVVDGTVTFTDDEHLNVKIVDPRLVCLSTRRVNYGLQ